MKFKDYYRILELDTYKVSNDEVKVAYRRLAKKFHPDINVNDRYAEERFKDINEAYDVLTDKTKKRKYDKMWISYKSKNGHFDPSEFVKKYEVNTEAFSEFFEIFFGKKKEEKRPGFGIKKNTVSMVGEDVETEIEITLEDAFYGATKTLSFRTIKGTMKNITVKIPEGIRQGEKIRIAGQGKPGINGGRDGDLYIKVKMLPNTVYAIEGANLLKDLKLTPWEAALGTNVNVEYLDGNAKITIPPGIQSGDKLRLPRKGYKNGIGGRGDLVLEVKIQVPKNLDAEEKVLFEKLSEISNFQPRK
ncbi:MAG: J domain-containing protein [Clostridiales bacterium]|nr:J domain-containing protein [Clostridiales bacterium]